MDNQTSLREPDFLAADILHYGRPFVNNGPRSKLRKKLNTELLYCLSFGFPVRMVLHTRLPSKLRERAMNVAALYVGLADPVMEAHLSHWGIKGYRCPPIRLRMGREYLAARRYLFEDLRRNPALYARHLRDLEVATENSSGLRGRFVGEAKKLERRVLYLLNRIMWKSAVLRHLAAAGEHLFLRSAEVRGLLERIRPTVLVTTYPINPLEAVAMAEAKRLGITTAVQLLSWDNITSKGRFPVVGDYFISWGPIMTKELQEYYGVARERVFEAGVAHFDEQLTVVDHRLRATILTQMRLNPHHPYILFGMSSPIFAPREIDLIEELAKWIRKDEFGSELNLVVRPHPQNVEGYTADPSWLPRLKALEGPRVGVFWPKLAKSRLQWALEESDLPALASMMAGCTINLNSGSTFAIDGLVHRKPVVLTFFDAHETLPWHRSARRCVDYIHLRKLIDTGGLFPVFSFEELHQTLHKLLKNPDLNMEARIRALHAECGPVDGRAAERIADALVTILERANRSSA